VWSMNYQYNQHQPAWKHVCHLASGFDLSGPLLPPISSYQDGTEVQLVKPLLETRRHSFDAGPKGTTSQ